MKLLFLILLLLLLSVAQSPGKTFFNQAIPGQEPVLFSPGVISDEFGNRDMAISPDGTQLFYTFQYRGGFVFSTIMHCRKVNGKWSAPEVAAFCGQYNDLEPAFSADGKKLYFASNRPFHDSTRKDFDLWVVEMVNDKWGQPVNLGEPVNSEKNEFYPSVAKSGNIYFTREMTGKDEDIVVCRLNGSKYDTAMSLPPAINSEGAEFNAFVGPDEQYIIYTAYKRKGNFGTGDLYISRKSTAGEWLESKNLGEKINNGGLTYCPYVSPDRRFLFFSSSRGIFRTPFATPRKAGDLKKLMHSPWNGWDNIFWVDGKTLSF